MDLCHYCTYAKSRVGISVCCRCAVIGGTMGWEDGIVVFRAEFEGLNEWEDGLVVD